jgi:hypothetical protein
MAKIGRPIKPFAELKNPYYRRKVASETAEKLKEISSIVRERLAPRYGKAVVLGPDPMEDKYAMEALSSEIIADQETLKYEKDAAVLKEARTQLAKNVDKARELIKRGTADQMVDTANRQKAKQYAQRVYDTSLQASKNEEWAVGNRDLAQNIFDGMSDKELEAFFLSSYNIVITNYQYEGGGLQALYETDAINPMLERLFDFKTKVASGIIPVARVATPKITVSPTDAVITAAIEPTVGLQLLKQQVARDIISDLPISQEELKSAFDRWVESQLEEQERREAAGQEKTEEELDKEFEEQIRKFNRLF